MRVNGQNIRLARPCCGARLRNNIGLCHVALRAKAHILTEPLIFRSHYFGLLLIGGVFSGASLGGRTSLAQAPPPLEPARSTDVLLFGGRPA
jgi:hypothetical protein